MSDVDTILRAIKPRVMSWISQSTSAASATGGVKDHGLLTGLLDDDHTQYVHISTARSISAQHTFAPSSPAAPFVLSANAQSQLVTGLYADQLNKSVTAGDGLSGGGDLTASRTISLTTPGTLSYQSTNSSVGSHTHAITNESDPGAKASILSTDASGVLTLVTLKTEVLQDRGVTGSILINPTGDISLDPGGNDVLPVTNYEINLGSISKKYLTLWAAELWVETLVAQDVIATIGGHVLVAPTTLLVEDCVAADTHIHVKHNNLASGDRIYLNSTGKIEWMAVTSSPVGSPGNYSYNVTRNLDGSGANDWYAGDAVLNTGTTDDGYIDIYSVSSIRSGTQYGPTIVGNIRTGTTYNAIVEVWAIGNLNGLYNYSADTYGVGLGKYANTSSYITIDDTGGVKIKAKSALGTETTKFNIHMDGDLFIGTDVSAASSTVLAVFTAAQTYNSESVSGGDLLIGDNSSSKANIFWDKSAGQLKFRSGTTSYSWIDTDGAMVVNAGASLSRTNAINFTDGSNDIGRVSAYYDTNYRYMDVRVYAESTKAAVLYLVAGDLTGASSGSVSVLGNSTYGQAALMVTSNVTNVGTIASGNVTLQSGGLYVGRLAYPAQGDIHYTGALKSYKNSTDYTGYIFVPLTTPLTSTSWDGDARSDTTKTSIDLSSVFGVPAGIKAVLILLTARDSASSTNVGLVFLVSPNNTSFEGAVTCRPSGILNDAYATAIGICPCDANGDIYYQIDASGSGTMDCWIQIWGYFI